MKIKCLCCNGESSLYLDPANCCGFCNETHKVSLWEYVYWKFSERFLWAKTTPSKTGMKVKLIKHNTEEQQRWGDCDDTKKYLKVGKIYDCKKEVHDWHTKLIINNKKFNSVCFEELTPANTKNQSLHIKYHNRKKREKNGKF